MKVDATPLPGVLLFSPSRFADDRGYFFEAWRESTYKECGIASGFVQDNVSMSHEGVLRGLHFQNPRPQGKLVSVLRGEVFDVAVDIRKGSPTFSKWFSVALNAENGKQLWIPAGFAHGFLVLKGPAIFSYKCTAYYAAEGDACIRWDDPDIGIDWPTRPTLVSPKDATAPFLKDIAPHRLDFAVTG